MPSNPSPSDSSNNAVRYLLRKAASFHLKSMYNHKTSWGKDAWDEIVTEVFSSECAFCGINAAFYSKAFELEHIFGLNRTELGLHHPGNTVPVCKECNNRKKVKNIQIHWEEHLENVCKEKGEEDKIEYRRKRINDHMNEGKWRLPVWSDSEREEIRRYAEDLYEDISDLCNKAVTRYSRLKKSDLQ